jgi:predicted ferric reductase
MDNNDNKDISTGEYSGQNMPSLFLPVMMAVFTGIFLGFVVLPSWVPSMVNSTLGTEPKAFWYLSRSTAIISYVLLWLSMALGVTMTGKLAQQIMGVPAHYDLHMFISFLGLGFALIHGLLLTGDKYINITVSQVFIPFSTVNYSPFWVGLGQIAFYAWAIIILSHYVRKITGRKVWRAIHYTGYGAFLIALAHGLASGTDAGSGWAFYMYWISAGLLTFFIMYRILVHRIGLVKTSQTARE